jgi:hypothetical protein
MPFTRSQFFVAVLYAQNLEVSGLSAVAKVISFLSTGVILRPI